MLIYCVICSYIVLSAYAHILCYLHMLIYCVICLCSYIVLSAYASTIKQLSLKKKNVSSDAKKQLNSILSKQEKRRRNS